MGVWESGEDGISLISLGRDGVLDDASGKNQAAADRYCHQLHLKPWAQVPGGSGLGVNAEDHGSWPIRWSFLYRIPYRIWFETSMGLGQCGGRFYIGFHIVWFETSRQEVEAEIIFPPFRLLSRQRELVQDQSYPILATRLSL